jgi:hypothetical protein
MMVESYERELRYLGERLGITPGDVAGLNSRIEVLIAAEFKLHQCEQDKARLQMALENETAAFIDQRDRLDSIRSQLDEWDASKAGVGFGSGRATLRKLLDGVVERQS